MDAFPLIEVVPIDGKGLGVKAVTDIRAKTLIISEEPILMGPSAAGMILGQFNTRVPVTQASEMAARLKTRSAEDLRMFLGCTNAHPKLNPFLGIFRTNALPILCGDEKKGGFFPIACRINHSCAPNSLNTWNNDLLRLDIYTIRDVHKGEEITISYTNTITSPERQRLLQAEYGFVCQCEVCALEGPVRLAREESRYILTKIIEAIPEFTMRDPEQGLQAAKTALHIIDSERLPWLQEQVYLACVRICAVWGEGQQARFWAETAVAQVSLVRGNGCKDTQQLRIMGDDPKALEIWAIHGNQFPNSELDQRTHSSEPALILPTSLAATNKQILCDLLADAGYGDPASLSIVADAIADQLVASRPPPSLDDAGPDREFSGVDRQNEWDNQENDTNTASKSRETPKIPPDRLSSTHSVTKKKKQKKKKKTLLRPAVEPFQPGESVDILTTEAKESNATYPFFPPGLVIPPTLVAEEDEAQLNLDVNADVDVTVLYPLQHTWILYHSSLPLPALPAPRPSSAGAFCSVQGFCRHFNWLKQPSQVDRTETGGLYLLKEGIEPVPSALGGKWVLTIRSSELLDRCWLWLTMALIGEQFDDDYADDICGAVISFPSHDFPRLELWTRGKSDDKLANRIGAEILQLLELEPEEEDVVAGFKDYAGARVLGPS